MNQWNERELRAPDRYVWYAVKLVLFLVIGMALTSAGMWAGGYATAAAFCSALTAALLLLWTWALGVAVGAWYTRQTLLLGADVAVRAQDHNDRWDAKKIGALAQYGRAVVDIAQRTGQLQPTAPPIIDVFQSLPELSDGTN